MVNIYKAGNHLESPLFQGLLTFCRGKEMSVAAKNSVIANYDGECHVVNHVCFKVIPKAVRFIVPD